MKIEQLYQLYQQSYLVDTDTRCIRKKSLFFALKGEKFNGNTFAKEALKKGASYAIIDEKKYACENTILVKSVLKTLQELAQYHRKKLGIPIIAITGSNGKTTTKELVKEVLSKKYKVIATKGNLNNHIGVPLTLLSMNKDTEIGIVEMGANHLNEISFLCKIANPNYGYITNFGKAHLEGFGSFEGVVKGKSELYEYLNVTNGEVFVNNENQLQLKQSEKNIKNLFPKNIHLQKSTPFVELKFNEFIISSHLTGNYNYTNIVAAISVGLYFKINEKQIKEAIESYTPSNNRSQIIQKNNTKIILDAYNANPTSMKVALKNFSEFKSERRVLFLGDMFELGKHSEEEHQKIYDLATILQFDLIILIGNHFSKVTTQKNTFCYKNFEELKKEFANINVKNTTILIKASRGMALERIVDLIS